MAQGDRALLRAALELEQTALGFYARARREAQDEFLAATLHFLETQRTLALHQLEDEALRLGGDPLPAPSAPPPPTA